MQLDKTMMASFRLPRIKKMYCECNRSMFSWKEMVWVSFPLSSTVGCWDKTVLAVWWCQRGSPLPGGLGGSCSGAGDWHVILFSMTTAGWAAKLPKAQDRDSSFDKTGNCRTVKETLKAEKKKQIRHLRAILRMCKAMVGRVNTNERYCQYFCLDAGEDFVFAC